MNRILYIISVLLLTCFDGFAQTVSANNTKEYNRIIGACYMSCRDSVLRKQSIYTAEAIEEKLKVIPEESIVESGGNNIHYYWYHFLKGYIALEQSADITKADMHFKQYFKLYSELFGILNKDCLYDLKLVSSFYENFGAIDKALVLYNWILVIDDTMVSIEKPSKERMERLIGFATDMSRLYGKKAQYSVVQDSLVYVKMANLFNAQAVKLADDISTINPYFSLPYAEFADSIDRYTYFLPSYKYFPQLSEAEKIWKKGEDYKKRGNIKKATVLLNQALGLYKEMLPERWDEYYKICTSLMNMHLSNDDVQSALNLILDDVNAYMPTPCSAMNLPSYRLYLLSVAKTFYETGNIDTGIAFSKMAKWLFEVKQDFGFIYIQCLMDLSDGFFQTGQYNGLGYIDVIKSLYRFWGEKFNLDPKKNLELEMLLSNLESMRRVNLGLTLNESEEKALVNTPNGRLCYFLNRFTAGIHLAVSLRFEEAQPHLSYCWEHQDILKEQKRQDLLTLIDNLGAMYALCLARQSDSRSIDIALRASDRAKHNTIQQLAMLPSGIRERYYSKYSFVIDLANLVYGSVENNRKGELLYNNAMFAKSLQLRTTTAITNEVMNSGNQELIDEYKEVNRLKLLYTSGNDSIPDDLGDRILTLENKLLHKIQGVALLQEEFGKQWEEVHKVLNDDEVAIEFLRVLDISSLNSGTDRWHYYALLLRKDVEQPIVVSLPNLNEDTYRELVNVKMPVHFLNSRKDNERAKYWDRLYSNRKDTRNRQYGGHYLYNAIWAPIEEHLQGITTIYYSPDGILHSCAIQAINDSTQTCLSDRYTMNLVTTTGEIERLKKDKREIPASAVVYGGIKYDVAEEDMIAAASSYDLMEDSQETVELLADGTRGGGMEWNFLDGSLIEAQYVKHILDSIGTSAQLFTGLKANEESFKNYNNKSPKLMHIATHGFYLSDSKQIAETGFMQRMSGSEDLDNRPSAMQRSGLIFSGGNRAWLNDSIVSGIEDGVLIAEEIAQLNLSGTDIVVLSACQTGLGEVTSSEGVHGLQRAFKLAGVKTLIMSLWQVPDNETSLLMNLFYDKWLGGMDKKEAFRAAQNEIRKTKPNPYYWAGFVMLD